MLSHSKLSILNGLGTIIAIIDTQFVRQIDYNYYYLIAKRQY